jgi:hypothetical protein
MSLRDEQFLKGERDSIVVAMDKLREEAKPSCKHCYGRGYQGRIFPTGELVCCPCVMRNRDRKSREEAKKETDKCPNTSTVLTK